MKMNLTIRRWLSVALCTAAVTLSSCWAIAQYQQENSPNDDAPYRQDTPQSGVTSMNGKIVKETKNPHGDIDGWILEDGTAVHFPPHVYRSFQDQIKPGDSIAVQVTPRTDRDGRQIKEVVTVQKGDRTFTVEPPRRDRSEHVKEEAMKRSGTVTGFHENPHGDVDGIFLDDDTEVKFPPHMGDKIQNAVAIGDTIIAQGNRHVTPKGDVHLRADFITAKNTSIEIDHPKSPKPPKDHGPQEDWMTKKQADEMISELRAIRKLLEKRS
jgi:hypothetical protein